MALLSNSEPYEFAKGYVTSDPQVVQLTGVQSSARISWLRGFRYAFGDRTGEAYFTFNVRGGRGAFEVRVELTKQNGLWTVVRSYADSESGQTQQIVGANK